MFHNQSGFTAVELLVTLFVAAAFIVAGYQLFNVVIQDGGNTRAQSTAANVAYGYLRTHSDAATNPCSSQAPLTNEPISVDGLTDVRVSVTIQCAQGDTPSLSRIDVTIAYNKDSPQKTLTYSTYVDRSTGAVPDADITDGLVGWWKMNGNGNSDVGDVHLSVYGATPTTNNSDTPNTAYNFSNGTSQHARASNIPPLTNTNLTMTVWVYNPTTNNTGQFMKVGEANYLYGVGIGIGGGPACGYLNICGGPYIIVLLEGVRWVVTSTGLGTGWHMVSLVLSSSGVPSIYRDGVLAGTYAGGNAIMPAGALEVSFGGTPSSPSYPRWFNGKLDDARLYNRALTGSEILQLYNGGPR